MGRSGRGGSAVRHGLGRRLGRWYRRRTCRHVGRSRTAGRVQVRTAAGRRIRLLFTRVVFLLLYVTVICKGFRRFYLFIF